MQPLVIERETSKPRGLPSPRAARHRLGFFFMLLALASALKAHAQTPDEGLLLRPRDGGVTAAWQAAVALETTVDYRIRGLLAEVTVTQRYVNDSGDWLEGRYLLPLPESAAVGALRVRIGERLIEGEIREKEEAKAVYQAAAAQGHAAGLVEQQRPNLFRTAVANIAPGEAVQIEIGFWQPVRFADGEFSIALPLTLTPRYMPSTCGHCDATTAIAASSSSRAMPRALAPNVSVNIDLDAGLPLARIHSPTHAVTAQPSGRAYRVTLADLVEASDRDFELRWEPVPSRMPQSALFTEQLDGETYALMMLLPPTVPVAPVPRELILVIDHSGSMHGVSMAQAREAADRALARLRPDDRFNVIVFDDSTESLFPAPVPADPAIVAQARAWVRGVESEGGTEMLPALRAAFAGAPAPGYLRQVVLATDAAVGNEDELFRVIDTERGQARVFPVGIGSAPNDHFLRKAAELGRGSQVLIRDVNEVTERMDALLARLDQPAMRDLSLNLPAGAEVYPQALPDLYAGEPLQVVARLPVPKGTAQLHGLARDRAWSASLPLARGSVHSPGVGRLWARARIDALEDARRAGAPEDESRAGILEVALRHGLVSRYTSLVAVERTPVRPLEAGLASTQFANATPDGLAFAQGGTSARAELLLALVLALSALALVRLRH